MVNCLKQLLKMGSILQGAGKTPGYMHHMNGHHKMMNGSMVTVQVII